MMPYLSLFKTFNGMAYLPPEMARQHTHSSSNSREMPLNPHAEGGQVQPVLAR
jgi:hypothetical protein